MLQHHLGNREFERAKFVLIESRTARSIANYSIMSRARWVVRGKHEQTSILASEVRSRKSEYGPVSSRVGLVLYVRSRRNSRGGIE